MPYSPLHSQKMHQKMCSMRQQQESANETDNNRMPAAELRQWAAQAECNISSSIQNIDYGKRSAAMRQD